MSDFDNAPDELKDRDQWLLWDISNDTPRRPHWRGDFKISWSDPDQWHSFDEALAAADEVASWGIGYVTAAENPDYVTEDTARRVKQNLGLDLKTGRYQSGADVVVVSDEEGDNGD